MTARRNGLTLVEILVAIAILAIVSASVAGIFASIARVNRDATLEQQATVNAKAYFEDVQRHVRDGGAITVAALPSVPGGCTGPTVTGVAGGAASTVAISCPPAGTLALTLGVAP